MSFEQPERAVSLERKRSDQEKNSVKRHFMIIVKRIFFI